MLPPGGKLPVVGPLIAKDLIADQSAAVPALQSRHPSGEPALSPLEHIAFQGDPFE